MKDDRWIEVLGAEELPEDDVIGVTVGEIEVALYRVAGEVFATGNLCTHGMARLCDGFLDGHVIECPLHQGQFDVRTGHALCEPAVDPLPQYPVKIEGGRVYVLIDESAVN
jgi:naphthalene 1,2-dioxygenase system ferredoxin subunit